MTKLITIQHEATLRPLNLDVAYFDDAEKRKLSAYPTADRIAELVSKGLQVNAAQFLTYYLFHRKRVGKPGYGNYAELETKIEKALTELDGWVDFANGSLTSVPDAMPQDRTITERIGEAGSLCVVSQIHDLHDADWLKIREHSGPRGFPTLDYQFGAATASDGTRIIQVESKGTSVENAAVQTQNVKAQKVRIDKKKNRIRAMEEEGTYQYPASLRYGVICSIGRTGRLRCWLTDPPSENADDPWRYRLLARLQFMFDWVSFLYRRSQLAASFATRLKALQALKDPFALKGIPLMRGNGEPFKIEPYRGLPRPQGMFANMCRVTDGPAVGTLLKLARGHLLFVGVQRKVFEMAASQDFEAILDYRDPGGTIPKQLHCVIPRGRAQTMGILEFDDESQSDSPYIHFDASGLLHYSEGAMVFGIVTPRRTSRTYR